MYLRVTHVSFGGTEIYLHPLESEEEWVSRKHLNELITRDL